MTDEPRPGVHPSAIVDQPSALGLGVQIWHFSHVMPNAKIGANTKLGQNVFVGAGVSIGAGCKIQNNVSLYEGVTLEDDVFCGPSCVFTNVRNPRANVSRRDHFAATVVKRGATVGANATIVCGVTIGEFAFVGAGAVVTRDVQSYELVIGAPAKVMGWVGRHGDRLSALGGGEFRCPTSGWTYRADDTGRLRCLDWPEEKALP